eukprot:12961427-Ditylum_brightwellii.AAC.1
MSLQWQEATELMHKGFFGYRKFKDGAVDKKRRVTICLLFNGSVDDRNKLRKLIQDETLKFDSNTQVWLARLQTCASKSRVGRAFYSTPTFDISPFIHRVTEVIREKMSQEIKVSIVNEPAFETESEWRKWFDDHDLDKNNNKEILNLREVPTLYCDSKLATLLGIHMTRTFTRNPHKNT